MIFIFYAKVSFFENLVKSLDSSWEFLEKIFGFHCLSLKLSLTLPHKRKMLWCSYFRSFIKSINLDSCGNFIEKLKFVSTPLKIIIPIAHHPPYCPLNTPSPMPPPTLPPPPTTSLTSTPCTPPTTHHTPPLPHPPHPPHHPHLEIAVWFLDNHKTIQPLWCRHFWSYFCKYTSFDHQIYLLLKLLCKAKGIFLAGFLTGVDPSCISIETGVHLKQPMP